MRNPRMITVLQPWAGAIIAGLKDVENRSWSTRYRGDLIIQSGLRTDPAGVRKLDELGVTVPGDLLTPGVMLGMLTLADVVRGHDSRWASPYAWNWVLTGPITRAATQIRVRGGRGLLDAPPRWRDAFPDDDPQASRRYAFT